MLSVLLWSITETAAAKTYRNEELNSVRHHSHSHEHQSRQTRQQRETATEEKGSWVHHSARTPPMAQTVYRCR